MQKPFWHKKRNKQSPSDEDLDSIDIIPGCLTFKSHLKSLLRAAIMNSRSQIRLRTRDLTGTMRFNLLERTLKESHDEASNRCLHHVQKELHERIAVPINLC